MPAAKGNTYAEKWTEKTVLEKLSQIEESAKDEDCLWLGRALVESDLYLDVWRYWREKFADNQKVFRTIKRIEQIFEDRLFSSALTGRVKDSVAIFGLKNNHAWSDKSHLDLTSDGKPLFTGINVNIKRRNDGEDA